jgi:hypothetical protein
MKAALQASVAAPKARLFQKLSPIREMNINSKNMETNGMMTTSADVAFESVSITGLLGRSRMIFSLPAEVACAFVEGYPANFEFVSLV